MTDEQLFERYDGFGKKIDKKLYPYRWYLFTASVVLGFFAALYF